MVGKTIRTAVDHLNTKDPNKFDLSLWLEFDQIADGIQPFGM